jgi:hypothetical protein
MTMTLRDVHDRVRELAWRPDSELRMALSTLFDELEEEVEVADEAADEHGTSTALVRRDEPDPAEVKAADNLAQLTAKLEEQRLLIEELKLRLHHTTKLRDTLESTLTGTQRACEELRVERDSAKADALAARGETFSKLIDHELELRLQPNMNENEVRRVAQLLWEKEAVLTVLQCHGEASVVAGEAVQGEIGEPRKVTLILHVRDQQTWTFELPARMALFYLEVTAAAWHRSVDARYNEIMKNNRVDDDRDEESDA